MEIDFNIKSTHPDKKTELNIDALNEAIESHEEYKRYKFNPFIILLMKIQKRKSGYEI